VHLYRNLNQKIYIFALGIDPTTAVKLFDNITPNHIRKGQFLNAKAGSILDANQQSSARHCSGWPIPRTRSPLLR
jgi:hypothetical protein